MQTNPDVCVVEDHIDLRLALASALHASGISGQVFGSAEDFLNSDAWRLAACVVTDVKLPGLSGLDLLEELRRRGVETPVIVMSGQATVGFAVRAFKGGADSFLEKPFELRALVALIQAALAREQAHRACAARRLAQFDALSDREREVMQLMVAGLSIKAVARDLGITVSTAEKHRSRVLKKLHCDSVVELVRQALVDPFEGSAAIQRDPPHDKWRPNAERGPTRTDHRTWRTSKRKAIPGSEVQCR
jgi:two-component system response regulator FixJ